MEARPAGLAALPVLTRVAAVGGLLALGGCAALLPRNPVPEHLTASAAIPEMSPVRAWAGRPDPAMVRDLEASFDQESAEAFPVAADGFIHYAHLALSGGGSSGAFGAGFLNGWTTAGNRPVFKMVTGVSTGALMAPFAFLGPSKDDALREFFTTTSSRDIFVISSLLGTASRVLTGESLTDTGPLAALIERHVDAQLLREVAQVHDQGRRLYIGTVDLDSLRFVVWNMGLIARYGTPEALDLFRRVMLASASIPIVFPPVLFNVEAGGDSYDEMHVDGGVGARVFYTGGVFPRTIMRERGGRAGVQGREAIYVIHNGQLAAAPQPTRRRVVGIASRVLQASGRAAVINDLIRIYAVARLQEASYHWVTIPDGVEMAREEVFDRVRMTALYEVGYQLAASGVTWARVPPGLETEPLP